MTGRHDSWQVHKVLGVYVLLHFLYRGLLLVAKGRGLEGEKGLAFYVLPHILLNFSSFVFPLPKRRNDLSPMIWPAYRMHNLIFALRNSLGSLLLFDSLRSKIFFVCGFMVAADLTTWYFDRSGKKTTRNMPFFETSRIGALKSFYAQCQFHATFLSVVDPTLSFMCLLPIQLASFGMTLARKGIISSRQWHILYAAALWSLYFFVLCRPVPASVAIAGFLAGISKELRHHLHINKYALWGTCLATHHLTLHYLQNTLNVFEQKFDAAPHQRLVKCILAIAAARYVLRLTTVFTDTDHTTNKYHHHVDDDNKVTDASEEVASRQHFDDGGSSHQKNLFSSDNEKKASFFASSSRLKDD